VWTSGTRRLSARRRCPPLSASRGFSLGGHAASSSAPACSRPLLWLRPPPLVAAEPATANHIVGAGFQRARGRGRVPSRAGRSIRLGHLRCRSRDRGQCLRRGHQILFSFLATNVRLVYRQNSLRSKLGQDFLGRGCSKFDGQMLVAIAPAAELNSYKRVIPETRFPRTLKTGSPVSGKTSSRQLMNKTTRPHSVRKLAKPMCKFSRLQVL
jgi:hypothetical protein